MASAVIDGYTPERGESKYELWRPIIRAQRRATLERVHQNLAKDWSQRLSELLPQGERIEFEGLGFESFGNLSETDSADCQSAVFTIKETEFGGFLLVSGELARSLVETRLGVASGGDRDQRISLTRIERAIVHEALNGMLASLSDSYHAAGIGSLAVIRHSERLKDTLLFVPQDYLVVLRFRLGPPASPMRVMLAASSSIINAVRDVVVVNGDHRGSSQIHDAAAAVPVEVDIVLGTWSVPIDDLLALKPGDSIVLPDGTDAWIAARTVRLGPVQVEFDGRRVLAEVKRRGRSNAGD